MQLFPLLKVVWIFIGIFGFVFTQKAAGLFKQPIPPLSYLTHPIGAYFRQIMHDTEQLPLDIHLNSTAQTKAFQADAAGDMTNAGSTMASHRLYCCRPE